MRFDLFQIHNIRPSGAAIAQVVRRQKYVGSDITFWEYRENKF